VRGCLFVLIAAAAVLLAAAWFGAPVVASTVVGGMLQASGYTASRATVEVRSDPPLEILLGHADSVRIEGDDVAWHTFHASSLDLTLGDVDLFGRRAATVNGSISDVALGDADATTVDPPLADIAIGGLTADAGATFELPASSVERIVRAAFERALGRAIVSMSLAAPDIVRVQTGLGTVEGHLAIDSSGGLILTTPVATGTILAFDPSFPLHLTSVTSSVTAVTLNGRLDVQELLGG
jgi:hypothetical protein